jgi:hypothetical protein
VVVRDCAMKCCGRRSIETSAPRAVPCKAKVPRLALGLSRQVDGYVLRGISKEVPPP